MTREREVCFFHSLHVCVRASQLTHSLLYSLSLTRSFSLLLLVLLRVRERRENDERERGLFLSISVRVRACVSTHTRGVRGICGPCTFLFSVPPVADWLCSSTRSLHSIYTHKNTYTPRSCENSKKTNNNGIGTILLTRVISDTIRP